MHFSIITPSLNHGRFLEECLRSVASQREVSLEHLVLDGGSSDGSEVIAERFPGVEWVCEPDRGISHAINKGFEKAKGDWVMWLNADDRLKDGVLAEMLGYLTSSSADVCYGNWDFINASGTHLRSVSAARWSPFVHIHHECLIGSTAAFLRRSTVIDAGYRLREDFRYVMDGEFYARLADGGLALRHVPIKVADFRMHGDNASQRHLGRTQEMDRIMAAERQHVESRAIRRAYGVTLFQDPYLNGLMDGVLWIVARVWKGVLKVVR